MDEQKVNAREIIGKFLGFKLKDEDYAVSILNVREIIGMVPITRVPNMPEWIDGVINLRGKIIPVEDLNKKFKMGATEVTRETCIIIVEIEYEGKEQVMGIIVDSVTEVFDLYNDNVEDNFSFNNNSTEYITSFAKINDKVILVLDINKILSADQHIELNNIKVNI